MSQSVKTYSAPIAPPRLRRGDTVTVVSPASPVGGDRLDVGVAALAERYRIRVSERALERKGYLAGDDDVRTDELNRALRDPDTRAIVLSRGGYGLMRILDRLDADALRRDPKIIVGYSDATALLSWAVARAGVRGIHGPMAAHFGELSAGDRHWLMDMLESPSPPGAIPDLGVRIGAARGGSVTGPLIGGNLCLLSHLVGTPYEVRANGGVLFIEEVGERPYAIDRYLTHLSLAGALDGAVAVVRGELVRCEEKMWPAEPSADQVVAERLEAFGIPGLAGLPIGHGNRNLAFPYAGRCEVDFDASVLRLLDPAVA